MERILALLDGSIYSESVCHHASWIAGKLGAPVTALHVLGRREGTPPSDLSGALRLGARTELLEKLAEADQQRARLAQTKGHAILEDARTILEGDGVASVETRLRKGDLLDAIGAMEDDIRATVIGKRGEAADFAKGHLGSNLERIVRSSKAPVFVASREFKPIGKVLVAYDGSASAKVAIDRMKTSAVFEGLDITVLCVGKNDAATNASVEAAAEALRSAGHQATPRVVSGDPDEVLKHLVADEGFGLLVMGAYGHSRIRSLIIGSTTEAMIRSVQIPVLLYR